MLKTSSALRRGRPIVEQGVGFAEKHVVPAEVPHDLPDSFDSQGPVAADPPGKESMLPAELNSYQRRFRAVAHFGLTRVDPNTTEVI